MRKIYYIVCVFLLTYINAYASTHPTLDVYRSRQLSADVIDKRFYKELQIISDVMLSPDGATNLKNLYRMGKNIEKIYMYIMRHGKYAYLNITPIIYIGDNVIHISVDAVDKQDQYRMKMFFPEPKKSFPDPDGLLAIWQAYETKCQSIIYKEKRTAIVNSCPVYHCLCGFDEPAVRQYKDLFINAVPQHEQALVTILREDKDFKKRAAAAYLLAHIKNGKKLIALLAPSMYDPDHNVRNSVMRVLGEALEKIKVDHFPIDRAVQALDFPDTTDRNKALHIVQALIKQNSMYAIYIKQHAAVWLLAMLKQHQPNEHILAYDILKQLSGKHYPEHDYKAWAGWVKQQGNV